MHDLITDDIRNPKKPWPQFARAVHAFMKPDP